MSYKLLIGYTFLKSQNGKKKNLKASISCSLFVLAAAE